MFSAYVLLFLYIKAAFLLGLSSIQPCQRSRLSYYTLDGDDGVKPMYSLLGVQDVYLTDSPYG
jgi:hypothetical protein